MSDERTKKRLTDVLQRVEALRDELRSILNGLGEQHPVKAVLTHFDERWIASYAKGTDTRYSFNGGKDAKHVDTLLKTLDVAALKGRIDRYFADRDPNLVRQKHPFSFFVTRINAYVVPVTSATLLPPPPEIVCEHEPRCTSDAQHTRKRMNELRQPR